MGMMDTIINEHPGLHKAMCQSVVETLNEVLALDPKAINKLFANRVIVKSQGLIDHPTIQVGSLDSTDTVVTLGALGLINGLLGADENSVGFIGVETKGKHYATNDWIQSFKLLDSETRLRFSGKG